MTVTREPTPTLASEAASSTRGAWFVVARRELVTKLTDKSFVLGTVITIVIICGFMGWQLVTEGKADTYTLAATSQGRPVADALSAGVTKIDKDVKVTVVPVSDDAAGVRQVQNDDVDILLRPTDTGWTLVGKEEVDDGLLNAAATVVRDRALNENASAAGTSVAELQKGAALTPTILVGDADRNSFAKFVGFALAFLFYMASLGFGFTLAGSVVEEKASRLVEIIATKIPLRQLLWGKILGNSVLAVMQIAVYAAIGLIGISFTQYKTYLPAVSGAIGWFVVFFLVGFLFIACWWAVAGALASRNEDLQSTGSPLTFLMMAVFFSSFLFTGPALTVASYVPPFSTVLMPIRLLQGSAAWWEPVIAIAILLAAAAATVVLAERLYRRALMQTQGKLSIKQAWSMQD